VSRKMSDRWLAANKTNARESTGPKTTESKARSARNACKHGLLSKDVVLGDKESPAEFQELLERLYDQLLPEDAIEHALVDRVAACYWRLRRAQRYEIGAVRSAQRDGELPQLEERRHRLEKLRYELHTHRRNLQVLHTPVEDLHAVDQQDRERALIRASLEIGQTIRNLSDPAVLEAAIRECKHKSADTVRLMRQCESQSSPNTDHDHPESAPTSLAMLPDDEELDRLIRYETMLDRQLHRALRELRYRQSREPRDTAPSPRRADQSGRVVPQAGGEARGEGNSREGHGEGEGRKDVETESRAEATEC